MNTRRNVSQRHEEEIANATGPPHCVQVPPFKEDANVDQELTIPSPLTDESIRTALLPNGQIYHQSSTTGHDSTPSYDDSRKSGGLFRPHQQVTTMAYRLRDITRVNPPTFYGYKVYEDP